MLDFVDSTSRPGVAGVAYRSCFADGASLSPCDERGSSSRSVVADVACRPLLAGGASRLPLGAGVFVVRAGEVGARFNLLDLEDIVRDQDTVK
jgi:hypothetical protein